MDFMYNSWSEAWCAPLLPAHLPIDLPFPKDLYILYVVSFPLLFQPVFHLLNLLQAVPTANKCQWLLRSPIISLKWSKVFLQSVLQKPASQWKICICAYSASFKGWPPCLRPFAPASYRCSSSVQGVYAGISSTPSTFCFWPPQARCASQIFS